ncbi:hypothetical protein SKAU_G00252650 [Synaphobranchus kaupii]|uniref:Uncharacterized protein n=1 Tax=Synaphobranchus kaupii TaxID=118154 RepID=A0A9Q1IS06_SYNKA|nr:hypothetical protein SKAU_G00252650 [Synaphobranchus kaupii]
MRADSGRRSQGREEWSDVAEPVEAGDQTEPGTFFDPAGIASGEAERGRANRGAFSASPAAALIESVLGSSSSVHAVPALHPGAQNSR